MSDLKTWKIVLEIRYPAAAAIFDNRGKIAAQWQWTSDLSEWRISENQVSVHNKSGTVFLNAGYKATSVVMELPDSHSAFDKTASDFASWVLDILQVREIERIGLRYIQLAKRQHFKLLMAKMRESLLKISDDDWNTFGCYPEDIGFPFSLVLDTNKANFTVGPMKIDQMVNTFEAKEVKEKIPAVALFVDFDLYRINPDFSPKACHEYIREFVKNGGQQILDITGKFVDRYGGFK